MTPQNLINECRLSGVSVHLDGENLKLKGKPEAVRFAADRLRPFKAEIIRYQVGLMAQGIPDQVREFMEDGLTLAEAQALAALSVPVFSAAEWLAMIVELDEMIGIYCAAAGLTGEDKAAILSTRAVQSLASIPETLIWFHDQVAHMAGPKPTPAPDRTSSARSARLAMKWPEPMAPKQINLEGAP